MRKVIAAYRLDMEEVDIGEVVDIEVEPEQMVEYRVEYKVVVVVDIEDILLDRAVDIVDSYQGKIVVVVVVDTEDNRAAVVAVAMAAVAAAAGYRPLAQDKIQP